MQPSAQISVKHDPGSLDYSEGVIMVSAMILLMSLRAKLFSSSRTTIFAQDRLSAYYLSLIHI